jgi:hypothetical protein
MTTRPIYVIAREIQQDWKSVNYAAKPYLDAMGCITTINDSFGMDNGKTMVLYFLSNAGQWRGENAKRIKAELKKIVGLK